MDALSSPRNYFPTLAADPVTLVVSPLEEEVLAPIIELTSDNQIIWNLTQRPNLLSESNLESDLLNSIKRVIERKRGCHMWTSVNEFTLKITTAVTRILLFDLNQEAFKPEPLNNLIASFEELISYDDRAIKKELSEKDLTSVLNLENLNTCNLSIHNDMEAYLFFLLFIFSYKVENPRLSQKIWNEIKIYKRKTSPEFDEVPLVKKLSLLGLTRTMDSLMLLKVIEREMERHPQNTLSLLATKGYILNRITTQTEIKREPKPKPLPETESLDIYKEIRSKIIDPLNKVVETMGSLCEDFNKANEITAQTVLRSLLKKTLTGYEWDLDQNECLLNLDTWSKDIPEKFYLMLRSQYPDFKFTEAPPEINTQKKQRIHVKEGGFIDITGTCYSSIIPNKGGIVQINDFFNYLFLNGMFADLCETLEHVWNERFYVPGSSFENYFSFMNLLVALTVPVVKGTSVLKTYFSIWEKGNSKGSVFREKLTFLMYAKSLSPGECFYPDGALNKIISKIDSSIRGRGNPSVQLLKAEFLIMAERFKESRAILDSLDPKIKEGREYSKILCILEFYGGSWKNAVQAGEIYLAFSPHKELEAQDLSVGYNLSTIYRYTKIEDPNKVLKTRLIATLKDSQLVLYPDKYLRFFFGIVFNFFHQSDSISSLEVPFLENETPLMHSAKECILHIVSRVWMHLGIGKERMKEDPRMIAICNDESIGSKQLFGHIPEGYFCSGYELYHKKRYQEALSIFENVEVLVPFHISSMEYQARTLLKLNKVEEAYKVIKNCIDKIFYVNLDVVDVYIKCLMRLKRHEEALIEVRKVLAEFPEDHRTLVSEIHILGYLDRQKEVLEKGRIALMMDLNREDRSAILLTLCFRLDLVEVDYLLSEYCKLINHSGDHIDIKAFYMKCIIHLENNDIEKALQESKNFDKGTFFGCYLQSKIDLHENRYSQALENLKNCQSMKSKIKDSEEPAHLFIDDVTLKILEFTILGKMENHSTITQDNFKWAFKRKISEDSLKTIFEIYLNSCRITQRIDLALKICQKLLRFHPKSEILEATKTQLLHEFNEQICPPLVKDSIFVPIDNKASLRYSSEKVETKEEMKTKTSFIFSKKPNLYLEKSKESKGESPHKIPTHPALIKQMEADIRKAENDVIEMYNADPTQLEVHYPIRKLLERQFEPFAVYEKEPPVAIEIQNREHQPKTSLKPAVTTPAQKAPSKQPFEAPKRMTKSLEVASRELGLELPNRSPAPYQVRFEGAQIASRELCDNLILITKEDSRVHPLLKNPQFASRYLIIQLFRMVELMKPTRKGLTSERDFKANVELVFTECRNVVLLRNLITLHGHRTSFEDLKKFCETLVNSGVPDNLSCIAFGKKVSHPPFRFNLKELFPIAFKEEWESLEAPAKMKALLAMIDLELEFLGTLKSNYDLPLYEEKGRDACEVIKISVLRIGKAFSYMTKKLNIMISDSEFKEIVEASYKIRHQITKPNAAGLPRELQPKWLSAFISKHDMLRERIKWKFASWL